MAGHVLRSLRKSSGLTQAELAARAGVSRQLVGAVEAGRHLPRVDAAVALAAVLGVEVSAVFGPARVPVDAVAGTPAAEGSLVRAGWVGDRVVTAPARVGPEGWDVADGIVEGGALTLFDVGRPGVVVAGCEPGLEALERMLRENGMGAVAVSASSASAVEALVAGRLHAAVVHGTGLSAAPRGVARFRLTEWRVGLAAPAEAASGWWRDALAGRVPVVQREQGAGVQHTFENVAEAGIAGPRVGGHLEAARRAVLAGMPAVTIEPAALAVGALFHPIEVHRAELWVAQDWVADRVVSEALHVIAGRRFQRRLEGVGGYDLTGCGTRTA
jgi:DNA-binding XRE family transcriptional regulator